MIIGGLSETEVVKISELLESEKIIFNVKIDETMINANQKSIEYNLRHLSAPSITTHILSIEFKDHEYSRMSENLKDKLLEFGITDKIPEDLEFSEESINAVQSELLKGSKRLIGFSYIHQLAFMLILFAIYLIWK